MKWWNGKRYIIETSKSSEISKSYSGRKRNMYGDATFSFRLEQIHGIWKNQGVQLVMQRFEKYNLLYTTI